MSGPQRPPSTHTEYSHETLGDELYQSASDSRNREEYEDQTFDKGSCQCCLVADLKAGQYINIYVVTHLEVLRCLGVHYPY